VYVACYEQSNGGGQVRTEDYCTFDWDAAGTHHRQQRTSNDLFADGTQASLWVDPNTGGASNHSFAEAVAPFIGVAFMLPFDGGIVVLLVVVADDAKGLRPWLDSLAWWRHLKARPAIAVPPPPEPVIEDAVPAWVEDARPPGYD
jgi:hypothetical protein